MRPRRDPATDDLQDIAAVGRRIAAAADADAMSDDDHRTLSSPDGAAGSRTAVTVRGRCQRYSGMAGLSVALVNGDAKCITDIQCSLRTGDVKVRTFSSPRRRTTDLSTG